MRSPVKWAMVLAMLHGVPQGGASQLRTEAWTWAGAGTDRVAAAPIQEAGQSVALHPEGAISPWASLSSVQAPFWRMQESDGGSGWWKGAIIGGLVGAGVGLVAFLFVDSLPCDSCSGVSDSAASGAGPEFVLGFGFAGAAIGALLGR